MWVQIGSLDAKNRVKVDPSSLLKKGGAGSAYLLDSKTVLKTYHKYEPKQIEKLKALMQLIDSLKRQGKTVPEDNVVIPQQLVMDDTGMVIGFTMPYLSAGNEPMWQFLQKDYRRNFGITPVKVAEIFLSGIPVLSSLHELGICVGDHNHRNTFHVLSSKSRKLIDADSFAFGPYGSEGTDLFLDPLLYGKDLTKPIFKPGNDWLSYAVMLCYCMAQIHPYGGTHKLYRSMVQRAKAKVSVFSPEVKTDTSLPPLSDVFTPDLQKVLIAYFETDAREPFPAEVLADYIQAKSGIRPVFIPAAGIVPAEIEYMTTGTQLPTVVLLQTQGPILHTLVIGNTLYALADEDGKVVYYEVDIYSSYSGTPMTRRIVLFDHKSGTRYGVMRGTNLHGYNTTYLICNQAYSEALDLFAISDSGATLLPQQLVTNTFLGAGNAIFATSARYLYAMVSHDLFAYQMVNGELKTLPLRPFRQRQTWFAADPLSEKPRLFGYYNKFDQPFYWFLDGTNQYDVALPLLEQDEVQHDISVKFDLSGVLVLQLTERKGVEYIRLTIIDPKTGGIRHASPPIKAEDHFYKAIQGQVYRVTMDQEQLLDLVLHPTSAGIQQERVQQNRVREMSATAQYVTESTTMYPFKIRTPERKEGVVAVNETSVFRIG